MACRGQHAQEFTEPEMIAKIIRIGTRLRSGPGFSRTVSLQITSMGNLGEQ